MHLWLSFDDLVLFHLIDYTIFGACFSMILFLIGHHSGPIFGSYLLPFFSNFWCNFWYLFWLVFLHFASFFRFLSSVCLCQYIFAQILVQFSGASFGMFFCILHLFFRFLSSVCLCQSVFCTNFGAIFWCLFWHGFLHFASFLYFFFLIVILGHIFGLRLAIFDMELS